MPKKRPDFELTLQSAEKIVEMLDYDYDTFEPQSTPSEICQALGIDRRTFNSVISKVIFCKEPTEPQILLREHIMNIVYEQTFVRGTE